MRWATGITVFLLLLVVGAAAIGMLNHLSQSDTAPPPPQPIAEALHLPPPPAGSQWRYTAPRAYGAAEAGVEACTRSEADVTIGGGGRSGATLCLRRGGGYPYAGSIVLGDTSGHIACLDCAVRARFDTGASASFTATAASTDGSDYALFIRDGPGLAGELRRAATATFTLPVRGAGEQKATFNVAGLKWAG